MRSAAQKTSVVWSYGSAPIARALALTSADGTRLHASFFPARRPRAGLLLVHGLQSHAGWFEASGTARELADAGISCLAYDRRGSGRSAGMTGHADSADDFPMDLDAGVAALRRELRRASRCTCSRTASAPAQCFPMPQNIPRRFVR